MALVLRRALSLKEELMWDVTSDRVRIAERIAYTENKIGCLAGLRDDTPRPSVQSGAHCGAFAWARIVALKELAKEGVLN